MLKLKIVEGTRGAKLYAVGTVGGVRVNRSTGYDPSRRKLAMEALRRIEVEVAAAPKVVTTPSSRSGQKLKHGLLAYTSRPEGVGVTTLNYVTKFANKFAEWDLEDVMPVDVIRFVNHHSKSKSTIRREITAIQGFLNYLRDGVMLPPLRIRKPEEGAPKNTRFTEAERNHMLAVCEVEEPWFVPHLTFLFYTGARRSELCRLVWEDILLNSETGDPEIVLLRSRKGKKGKIITRRVPVHPVLLPILKALRMLRRPSPKSHVFLSCTGQPINTPAGVNKAFESVADAAGLGHLTPHDARRTFASQLLEEEVSDLLITNLLGHVDKKMLTTYAIPDDAVRSSAVMKISAPVGG